MTHRELESLPDGEYEVVVDTEHIDGSLTFSECVLRGESAEWSILVHTYTCHPSMANNELSGRCMATFLARRIAGRRRRLTYRFVFAPESIGAVTFLALRGEHLRQHLRAGLIATCVGAPGPLTYKRSRQGTTEIDRAADWTCWRACRARRRGCSTSRSPAATSGNTVPPASNSRSAR